MGNMFWGSVCTTEQCLILWGFIVVFCLLVGEGGGRAFLFVRLGLYSRACFP